MLSPLTRNGNLRVKSEKRWNRYTLLRKDKNT